jgi:hypothetical protein
MGSHQGVLPRNAPDHRSRASPPYYSLPIRTVGHALGFVWAAGGCLSSKRWMGYVDVCCLRRASLLNRTVRRWIDGRWR